MARVLAELKAFASTLFHSPAASADASVSCSVDGAPPMQTVEPVTFRPRADGGEVLSFVQEGVTRYACLNLPEQATEHRPVRGRQSLDAPSVSRADELDPQGAHHLDAQSL